MKCQKCGKNNQSMVTSCPYCNENYSLASVLAWIISEQGEDVLKDARSIKSNILDLCRDSRYDTVVFEGLLNQGFSKKIGELSKTSNFDEALDKYCETLSATYNIDKINYIADAFYFALTGKNRVHKKIIPSPVNTTKIMQNNAYASPPSKTASSTAQNLFSDVVSKIQTFDFQKFFANFNVQSIKTFIQKNKKASMGVVSIVALIIVISIISSIVGSINEKKVENTTTSNSSYESNDYIENNDNNYDYLTASSPASTTSSAFLPNHFPRVLS